MTRGKSVAMALPAESEQLKLRPLTRAERALVDPARLRHGAVMGWSGPIADIEGGIGQPLFALSTLALLERRGTITADERRAGDAFHAVFRRAALDGLKAADMGRVATIGAPSFAGGGGNEGARRRIAAAIDKLGGEASIAASCAWHVLGLEWSLREWAAKALRGNVHQATGSLRATLGLIARDFGA